MTGEKKANAKVKEYAKFLQDAYYEIYKELAEIKKENADLKAHCKAVDEVNEKMKCCSNCKHNYFDNEEIRHCDVLNQHQMVVFKKCDKWELAE